MNKVDIKKVGDNKYELYIDGKRACVGNLAAVVATLNANINPVYIPNSEIKNEK